MQMPENSRLCTLALKHLERQETSSESLWRAILLQHGWVRYRPLTWQTYRDELGVSCGAGSAMGNFAPSKSQHAAQHDPISFYQSEMASMLPEHSQQTRLQRPDRSCSGIGPISRDMQRHKTYPSPHHIAKAPR